MNTHQTLAAAGLALAISISAAACGDIATDPREQRTHDAMSQAYAARLKLPETHQADIAADHAAGADVTAACQAAFDAGNLQAADESEWTARSGAVSVTHWLAHSGCDQVIYITSRGYSEIPIGRESAKRVAEVYIDQIRRYSGQ